jgi:hypothetical protein
MVQRFKWNCHSRCLNLGIPPGFGLSDLSTIEQEDRMPKDEIYQRGSGVNTKIANSRVTRYRMRMECAADKELITWALRGIAFEISDEGSFLPQPDGFHIEPFWDVGMSFWTQTNLTTAMLRWIFNELTDCHVAAESLAAYAEYTGDRIELEPSEHCVSPPDLTVVKVCENLCAYAEYLDVQLSRAIDGELQMERKRAEQTQRCR